MRSFNLSSAAHASRIDSLTEVIEAYAASLQELSARRAADNVRRSDLLRSEVFSTAIRGAVREPTRLLDELAQRTAADGEQDEERHEQLQETLNRMTQDLQEMRRRVS